MGKVLSGQTWDPCLNPQNPSVPIARGEAKKDQILKNSQVS